MNKRKLMTLGTEGLARSERGGDDAKPRQARTSTKISTSSRGKSLINSKLERGKGNKLGGSEGK